ncbi:MAG TPA: hypothetical protein VD866_10800 [Urbifossiella sp.]|nr:hypothetical protein [Urbifossiella sp.]
MTPDLPDHPTDLTPLQRKALGNLRAFLDVPPTLGALYRKSLPALAIMVVFGGALIGLCVVREQWLMACFTAGIFFGAAVRDLGTFRRTLRIWPATAAVIDRDRLDRLLGEPEPGRDRP